MMAVMVFGSVTAAIAATPPRPNLILLLPDQMRASAMGVAGNPEVQTPNIDRMAHEGVRFKRTYAIRIYVGILLDRHAECGRHVV